MSRDLFRPTGKIYRGNLHVHCTHSDGRNEAAEVVQLYCEAGYDFTCLSDHYWTDPRYSAETVCDSSGLDSDDFITIISAELHCHGKLYDQAGLWHILANGLPLDFPIASATETGPELVSRAVAAGAFVSIPHPEWYAMTTEETRSLAEAGDYFASCGPAFISIRLDGNMLHVTCSPVDRIVIAAGGHRSFATSGNGMTEARIEISSTDFEFFRVVLTDRAGKQAWSNPYWIDDLGLH